MDQSTDTESDNDNEREYTPLEGFKSIKEYYKMSEEIDQGFYQNMDTYLKISFVGMTEIKKLDENEKKFVFVGGASVMKTQKFNMKLSYHTHTSRYQMFTDQPLFACFKAFNKM